MYVYACSKLRDALDLKTYENGLTAISSLLDSLSMKMVHNVSRSMGHGNWTDKESVGS